MSMLRVRAGEILRIVSSRWKERNVEQATVVSAPRPSSTRSSKRPQTTSSLESEQRPVKHSVVDVSRRFEEVDPLTNTPEDDSTHETAGISPIAVGVQRYNEGEDEEAGPLSSPPFTNFAYYFLQQYQDTDEGEMICTLLDTAFKEWIPSLMKEVNEGGLAEAEIQEMIGRLKSLFFVSLRCRRDFEARKVLKAILHALDSYEDKTDYWRFFMYEAYYFQGNEVIGADTDLFQRLMVNLTAADKQVCFSLKFEALLKNRRWSKAGEIEFSIPRLEDNVGLWIRLIECSMTLPVIHQDRDTVRDILVRELVRLGCAWCERLDVSGLVRMIVKQVKQRYPIHFSLLADTSAFLVISVIVLEGTQKGLEVKRDIEGLGLVPTKSVYINKLRTFAQHCFYGGFVSCASRLYEELLDNKTSHWEVWLCFGTIATMQGSLVKAERYLAKAVEYAELALGRSNSYASCLCFYANCLLLKGQYGAAETKYLEALRLCHQNRNHTGLIRVMHDFSCMYREQGAFEASIQLMRGCLKRLHLIEGRDRHREKAIVFQSTSLDHYMQGDMHNATLFHRKCANYYLDWNIGAGIPQREHLTSCRTAGEFWKGITGMSPQDRHKVKSAIYAKLVLFHAYPYYRGDGLSFGEELFEKIKTTCPARNSIPIC